MEETNNTASGKIVTALIIGLVVGFALGVFWEKRKSVSDTLSDTEETAAVVGESAEGKETAIGGATTTVAALAATSGAAVQVTNQPAGNSVRVSAVSVKETVWVAVREEKNGGFGNILGAQKVSVESKDVVVELLRPTKATAKYFVVLYTDMGSPAFNYREDALILGVQGTFTAQ